MSTNMKQNVKAWASVLAFFCIYGLVGTLTGGPF